MSDKKFLYFLIIHILTCKILATISVVDKGILQLVKNSVALQFFVDIENENHIDACIIHSRVNKCCLVHSEKEDCGIMKVYSETTEVIKPEDRNTLIFFSPMLYQHDLIGYCEMVLIYRCPRKLDKLKINIPFDTRIWSRKQHGTLLKEYIGNEKVTKCHTLDQNSLDKCSPTNCDLKYNGLRPFYDIHINRCIEVPVCLSDTNKELPDIVYLPHLNICKDLSLPLSIQDIYSIRTGLGTVTTAPGDVGIARFRLKSNCTTISQNLFLLKDLMFGKLCPRVNDGDIDYENCCKCAIFSILICILSVCAVLMSFVCCVNTILWVYRLWLNGGIEDFWKAVRSKFMRIKKKRRQSPARRDVKNPLLRGVVVNDIPLELRDSIISICDRVEKEVYKKKRYRKLDIGSQISLQKERTVLPSTDSTSSDLDGDRKQLVK